MRLNKSKYDKSNVAIIIVSCSKYADIWDIFHRQFEENWKDCPYTRYLISDAPKHQSRYSGIKNIFSDEDLGWGANLLSGLNQIPEEYVLYMAEDYLLRREVDTIEVEKVIKSAVCSDANYLLMSGCIEHDKWINEYFGELRKGREYRTSVYFSLFKKETFELLIKETESAWLFETEGAIRSMVFDKFFVTHKSYFDIIGPHSAVIKGKWTREAIKELKSLGYDTSAFRRPVLSRLQTFSSFIKRKFSKAIRYLVPFDLRLTLVRAKNGRFK